MSVMRAEDTQQPHPDEQMNVTNVTRWLVKSFTALGPARFDRYLLATFSSLLIVACGANKIEPVALAPEDMCSYCRMAISETRYAAEFVDQDGQAFKFDDIGCMANFIESGKNATKPAGYFVMDFDERQWIKAEDAFYVRSSELSTPMRGGVIAFKDKSKAKQAAAKYHGQSPRFAQVFKD